MFLRSFDGREPERPAKTEADARLEFLTGFEGTHIFGSGWDVLETTEHTARYPEDLSRLRGDGIRSFRACIPWHRIEATKGVYDWRWTDRYLACVSQNGLEPIADPLHHTSFPDWLTGGFADPQFTASYVAFIQAFARRYPWIRRYTVINEPFVTAWLSGYCEIWQPRGRGHACFVPMLVAVCRTICLAAAALSDTVPGITFIHADSCERHTALDEDSLSRAEQSNSLRFIVLDLILGHVDQDHPLYSYLLQHGMPEADVVWFNEHKARIDVLGLDYYSHSELTWSKEGRASVHPVSGFAAVALEYAERYGCAVMLSETNLRGSIHDRIGWLRYMVEECLRLRADLARLGLRFEGFCWYPFVDSTDWSSLVREARRDIDPQGVYSLDAGFNRNASELSEIYAALARGELQPDNIPARPFGKEALVGRGVANYLPHMPWHREAGH